MNGPEAFCLSAETDQMPFIDANARVQFRLNSEHGVAGFNSPILLQTPGLERASIFSSCLTLDLTKRWHYIIKTGTQRGDHEKGSYSQVMGHCDLAAFQAPGLHL